MSKRLPKKPALSKSALLFPCDFSANLSLYWQESLDFPDFFILDTSLHELSLTQNLIEIAEEHARREGATVIRSITMKLGALAGVIPDAVEFAFEICSKGTLADGATLEIVHVPAIGRCRQCASESAVGSLFDGCSICGSYALDILQGQEMALTEMEID